MIKYISDIKLNNRNNFEILRALIMKFEFFIVSENNYSKQLLRFLNYTLLRKNLSVFLKSEEIS